MTEYVDPSSITDIDQGDIFKDIYFAAIESHVNAVIITPTCDLRLEKAHFVKFAGIVTANLVMKIIADSIGIGDEYFGGDGILSESKKKSLIKAVDRNIDGIFLPRYYLLTKWGDIFQPCYVDLQQVFVIPTVQVTQEYVQNRVARLKSPWREQLVAQYTGYSMRVGTPECSEESILDLIRSSGCNVT